MMDGGSGSGGRVEAERLLAIADKLLGARDLVGSKHFAECALEADPLADGVDHILAVTDVLLASQRRINNQFDWYSVLQLPHPSTTAEEPSAAVIKRSYRRLALLLHPNRNHYPGADTAFRLVVDAFAVLSEHTKKSLFDSELRIATSAAAAAASASPSHTRASATVDSFWTACLFCFHVHQYAREYLNLSIRCPNCRRPFRATELASPPPVVAGTDMYYCSWGFFPLGFPGGPGFNSGVGGPASNFVSEWKPFYPMFPNWGNLKPPPSQQRPPDHGPQQSAQRPHGYSNLRERGKRDSVVESQRTAPAATRTKKIARKNVGGALKRRTLDGGNNGRGAGPGGSGATSSRSDVWEGSGSRSIDLEEALIEDLNINVKGDEGDPMAFHIDVDATDEILGNLQNLPFLKDDEIPLRMP